MRFSLSFEARKADGSRFRLACVLSLSSALAAWLASVVAPHLPQQPISGLKPPRHREGAIALP